MKLNLNEVEYYNIIKHKIIKHKYSIFYYNLIIL